MPSSFTSRLKLERQASGENSGNWGNLVNYVFNRIDSSTKGYQAVSVAGNANVTLTSNNSTTNTDDSTTDDQVHNAVLEFTGALTGNINVFTDAVETNYTVFNNTSGSYTLTFAPTGGSGVTLQQGAGNVSIANDKAIVDAAGNEQIVFSQTATEVNYLDITNSATGNNPDIKSTGSDANVGLSLTTTGAGLITFNDAAYNPETTLTDGATIDWDAQEKPVAKVTLAGNRTLNAASNGAAGQFVSLLVIQDATGSRTLTWNAAYEFAADTPPTLTTTANVGDLFVFRYNGTKWLEVGRNQALTLS